MQEHAPVDPLPPRLGGARAGERVQAEGEAQLAQLGEGDGGGGREGVRATHLAQLEEQHGHGHRADEHAEGAALLAVRAHAAEALRQQPRPRLGQG